MKVLSPGALYWPAERTLIVAISDAAFAQASLFDESGIESKLAELVGRCDPSFAIVLVWGDEEPEWEAGNLDRTYVLRDSLFEWQGMGFSPKLSNLATRPGVSIAGSHGEFSAMCLGDQIVIPCLDATPETVSPVPPGAIEYRGAL